MISFSELGNSLSQWRAYAPRDGVAIGFYRGALNAVEHFALRKCSYTREREVANNTEKRQLRVLVDQLEESVRWVSRLIQDSTAAR